MVFLKLQGTAYRGADSLASGSDVALDFQPVLSSPNSQQQKNEDPIGVVDDDGGGLGTERDLHDVAVSLVSGGGAKTAAQNNGSGGGSPLGRSGDLSFSSPDHEQTNQQYEKWSLLVFDIPSVFFSSFPSNL